MKIETCEAMKKATIDVKPVVEESIRITIKFCALEVVSRKVIISLFAYLLKIES